MRANTTGRTGAMDGERGTHGRSCHSPRSADTPDKIDTIGSDKVSPWINQEEEHLQRHSQHGGAYARHHLVGVWLRHARRWRDPAVETSSANADNSRATKPDKPVCCQYHLFSYTNKMSRELELAAALRPVLLRLNNAVRRQVPSAELTAAQCTALATVLDHGPLRMGELAERERVSMPTTTTVIRRMEKLGLVQRRPDPDDGRAVLVELTPPGRKRLEDVAARRNVLIADLLGQLDADQRDAIAAAIPALSAMLALDPSPHSEPAPVATTR